MNKHKIDQLFQNKISDMEITPSAAAKAKFEQALAQKHTTPFVWWRVAAVLLVLAVSSILIIRWGDNNTPDSQGLADANTPLPATTPAFVFSENELDEINNEVVIRESIATESQYAQVERQDQEGSPATEKKTAPEADKDDASALLAKNTNATPITLEAISEETLAGGILMEEETLVAEQTQKKTLPVTIIYKPGVREEALIADAKEVKTKEEEEEKLTFMELLQATANRPLMAELRGAKDEFISGSISFKPKKSKN